MVTVLGIDQLVREYPHLGEVEVAELGRYLATFAAQHRPGVLGRAIRLGGSPSVAELEEAMDFPRCGICDGSGWVMMQPGDMMRRCRAGCRG